MLMQSFVTGELDKKWAPLESLMSPRQVGKLVLITWVPYHMEAVLRGFSDNLPLLENIANCFRDFADPNDASGDAREQLFLAVLLIRYLARMPHPILMPFVIEPSFSITQTPLEPITYQTPLNVQQYVHKTVDSFVEAIGVPAHFPHVAVYFPPFASFPLYDVIVAHWDAEGKRKLYGYQLKEGDGQPKASTLLDSFEGSFLIRGDAPLKPLKRAGHGKDWIRPRATEITDFFGVSGQQWTPEEWRKLRAST